MTNDSNSNNPPPGDDSAQENAATSEGRAQESSSNMPVIADFVPQAVICFREAVTHAGPQVECIVQYDSAVHVANPSNPKGDAIPDMSNIAVYMARWLELNMRPVLALAMNSYVQQQKIVSLSAASERRERIRLLDATGKAPLQ